MKSNAIKGFSEDNYLAPSFNLAIYIIGLIVISLYGVFLLFSGYQEKTMLVSLGGIGMIVGGNLVWRMLCELVDVQFKIHSELQRLNRR